MEQLQLPRRRAVPAAAGTAAGAEAPAITHDGSPIASSPSPTSTSQSPPNTWLLSRQSSAELRAIRKLSAFAVLAHIGSQVAPLLAWPQLPAAERAQRLASIALLLGFHLLLHAAPRFYLSHKTQLHIALRLAYYAFPLLRKPRGIQATLNREATPGLAGAALDLLRVAWGTRLVAVLLTSLITPLHILPLVPHLLLQMYAIVMVRSNSTLCAAPLLAHPLTQQRVQLLHRSMDMLLMMLPAGTLLLPGGVATAMQPSDAGNDGGSGSQQAGMAAAQCEGALNLLAAVLGLLVPLIFLIKTEDAASLARLQARREFPHSPGVLDQLAATWHRAEAGADQALRSLVGRSWLVAGPPLPEPLLGGERWLTWVQLLAMTWAWCAAPARASAATST